MEKCRVEFIYQLHAKTTLGGTYDGDINIYWANYVVTCKWPCLNGHTFAMNLQWTDLAFGALQNQKIYIYSVHSLKVNFSSHSLLE